MRYPVLFAFPLALLCLSGPAAAHDCGSLSSNVEIGNCLQKAYQQADAELNKVWKQVLGSVDRADYMSAEKRAAWKDALQKAQRAWIEFREHDCKGAVGFEWDGGSGAGGAITSCMLGHTGVRTEDLRNRYLNH
jgi:uncharacterized protein YecT (DUF1311 family)